MLYTVKEKLFKETYFLVYGEGKTAHRVPNLLIDGKKNLYSYRRGHCKIPELQINNCSGELKNWFSLKN